MQETLLIATGNQHKLEEIKQILQAPGLTIIGSKDVGGIPDVVEDGVTFEENAIKKAVEIAKAKNTICLADDSGLEVFALNNEPGVFSARYAGVHGDDKANRRRLLAKLSDRTNRDARFVCVIAIAGPDGLICTASGECQGKITFFEKGDGGFGYDSIFIPNGFTQTFAELSQEIKNELSHRFNAIQNIKKQDFFKNK